MIKVSVVVPIYNASTRIVDVLDSIINQSYNIFEIILINDSSSDDTLFVLENYVLKNNNFNFKIIDLKENKGVSFCRNLGWDHASGDYIAFLDSDDYWNENKIEIMIKAINSLNIDLIGHDYCETDISCKDFFSFKKDSLIKIGFYKLLLRNKFQTSCVLVKNKLNFRFDESISHCEDYELFIRLAAHNKNIYYYKETLTYLGRPQLSKGGLSEKKIKMRVGEIKAYTSGLIIKKLIFLLPLMIFCSILKSVIKINR